MNNTESENTNAVLSMKIEGAYCTSCVAVLTKSLLTHEGISSVKVSPQLDEVRVEYEADSFTREEIERIIQNAVSDSFIPPQPKMLEDSDFQADDFKPPTAIDPVCHMVVHIDENSLYSDFDEARYYFCAKSCKSAFEKEPKTFLNSEGLTK